MSELKGSNYPVISDAYKLGYVHADKHSIHYNPYREGTPKEFSDWICGYLDKKTKEKDEKK